MTTADDGSDLHVDLLGLLEGELADDAATQAVTHVRGCAECTGALLELTVAMGRLRDARRYQPADPSEVPPLRLDRTADVTPELAVAPVPEPRAPRSLVRPLLAAAAVVVALVGGLAGGIAIGRHDHRGANTPAAGVTLTAIGLPTTARGQAHMIGAGEQQKMQLTVAGLATPPPADHYEVWLLDTATGKALPVGPVTGGDETFPLPASEVAGFDAIDVSLQAPEDGTTHSGHSVLRGTIA